MIPESVQTILLFLIGTVGVGAVWYFISQKDYHRSLWVGFTAAILLLLVIALYIRNCICEKELRAKTPTYFGELVPSNESCPPLPPDLPNDTFSLLLGDDLRVLAVQLEKYVLSKDGKPFLSIGIRNGLMKLTLSVMDSNNKKIIQIINNEFQAYPENAFNPKQPDKHSLVVRDSRGIEVLNVRFINPKAMRIVGRFHLSGHAEPVLILADEGVRWPGGGGIGHLTVNLTESKGGFLNFR